jgi:glycosyltransferase involved in cell wall biosynthesis
MTLRVVMVTAFPKDPDAPHGGVEAVSVNLARALAALDDLELHVITTDAGCPDAQRSDWAGVAIHRLPKRGRHVLTDALGPGRRLVSAYVTALAPDVVHAHDVFGLMVKGLPIPRVFTIHGFIHGDTLVSGTRLAWLRARLWQRVETAAWADQPHIVSISPYVRERLSGIATGVIHDIDNPIAPAFFELPRCERKGTIFSAALICRRKNPLALVEALARLVADGGDVQLRLAGAIRETDYSGQLRQRIENLGLNDRVHLLGPIGSAQVRDELSAASVFALVSLEEGSPMGIEEAMAAGVPVVTSNRCGMPYLVRDGESGFLVDPHDPADIAGRLGELLAADELRAQMGRIAQRIALDRFHPDAVARRTHEVYRRAVQNHHQGNGHARQ